MPVPDIVAEWEELGRGIYSAKVARRARKNRVPYNVFLPPAGETSISVDRLSIAPPDEAIGIARGRAANREGEFRGWATVTAEAVREEGRTVVASPIGDENPYHADIVLPASVASAREKQKHHALALARCSGWREVSNLV